MEIINHIEIRNGTGFIARRNLKAELVARMVVDEGATPEATATHYNIQPAEVHAAISFYYDNQAILDEQHHAAMAWAAANGRTLAQLEERRRRLLGGDDD